MAAWQGYTNLLLISTSMILVPYLLIGLFLLYGPGLLFL